MATIYSKAYFKDSIIDFNQAKLSIASSAVLYGLSVYTVFHAWPNNKGGWDKFRLNKHFERLINSSKIIGFEPININFNQFEAIIDNLIAANNLESDVLVRVTIHGDSLLPGTKSEGLEKTLSIFIYKAEGIFKQTGVSLKTTFWKRNPDTSIPSRAKINGGYVNNVLGSQDAKSSGFDDCLFLTHDGKVSELSAANIFMVKNGEILTPTNNSDILEGINRQAVIDIASELKLPFKEKSLDLSELYAADELFACGSSAFITPIINLDGRHFKPGEVTDRISREWLKMHGKH